MKLKIVLLAFVLSIASCFGLMQQTKIYADDDLFTIQTDVYTIYDDNLKELCQKDVVEVGDSYMSKDYKYYEIVYVDSEKKTALAKFVREVQKPKVEFSTTPGPISIENRVICMYMTHNDESYVPTDGVDSIYGNGGIKDVALAFKSELEKYFINVYFDDTLHIPHDTSAYSRSLKTAKSLQSQYSPDALFDIHRDGASRKFYVTEVDGEERGRVRMVIGKANANMALNEEFALYLMAVGNELYPWLFTDIYYASGHYNQSIDSKAILFEMGSHLVEKELVIDSMKELAEVVTTAMYKTTINTDTGDLTVNGTETKTDIIVNDILDEKENSKTELLALCVVIVLIASVCVYAFFVFFYQVKKAKK